MQGYSTSAITMLVLALAIAHAAGAQTVTILQTGFEPAQGYFAGNLAGQNGWSTYLGEDPTFGEIVSTGALAGSQSVLLDGLDVVPGTFGNYAGVRRGAAIAPTLANVPLRYVETTGLCKIIDPTIITTHDNVFYIYFWSNTTPHAHSGPGCINGQYRFGVPVTGSLTIPAQPNVTFQFRHLLDYRTGISRAWMNGQLAYESSSNTLFNEALYPTIVELNCSSSHQQFDTRVWYDDLHIKAVYGCGADVNYDFAVNINDLLAVINTWGPCPSPCPPVACAADISPNTGAAGDCQVNINDLLEIINHWGACQ